MATTQERLLHVPDLRFHRSLVEVVAEFAGARMDGAGPLIGTDVETVRDEAAFARLVAGLTGDHEVTVVDGSVPASSFWLVEGDELVGFLQVRYRLTPFLLEQGGHIGYSVRPSARGRGLAARALAEAVGVARELGLDRVLVACAERNVASRTVIERSGGAYEDSRQGLRRYWIDTGRRTA
jgi:predicted acetyltransferase